MKKLAAPNYTQSPNVFYDEWLPKIDNLSELKVVDITIRETFGWHRDKVKLSLADYEKLTGLVRNSVIDGLQRAMEDGYLGREKEGNGFLYFLNVEADTASANSALSDESGRANPAPVNSANAAPAASATSAPLPIKKEMGSKKEVKKDPAPAKSAAARRPVLKRDYDAITKRVFEKWQDTFKDVIPTGQYKLTGGKKRMIGQRLRSKLNWSEADLMEGIAGLRHSPHHMGVNDTGQFWLHPKYAFKDDDQLEKMIQINRQWLADHPPKPEPCQYCDDRGFIVKPARRPEGLTPVPAGVWEKTLGDVSTALAPETFQSWFSGLSCEGVNCDAVYILAPTAVVKDWVEQNYGTMFLQIIAQNFGKTFEVGWLFDEQIPCKHGA
jgi:hypothetical protein